MKKLLVFETDLQSRDYVLRNKAKDNFDIGSLERGAGSAIVSISKGETYDMVFFVNVNYFGWDYGKYAELKAKFVEELIGYDLVNNKTLFL